MEQYNTPDVWQVEKAEAGRSYSGKLSGEAAIVIVVSGSLLVNLQGNQQLVGTGGIWLFPPDNHCECIAKENICVVICRFSPENLWKALPVQELLFVSKPEVKGFSVLEATELCCSFLKLWQHYTHGGMSSSRMQELKRKELFLLLLLSYSKEELAMLLQPILDEKTGFRNFVIENWKKARNVIELAALANLSTSGFMKKFRKCFGESAYHWMTRQKAECILKEITANHLSLKDIADKYHFASYAHFGTFCKMQYGGSPKAVQQRVKEGVLATKL